MPVAHFYKWTLDDIRRMTQDEFYESQKYMAEYLRAQRNSQQY